MSVLQDVRIALRLFHRTPSVTAIALFSIALSVAATAVVFAAIKSVLIDPLPYADPGRIVQIGTKFAAGDPAQSHADFAFWNDAQEISKRTRTLQSVGVYGNSLANLAGDSSTPPEALYGLRVSANLFPTLGVTPMIGRNILPEEDQIGHSQVMILSYGLWKRRFNSDRKILGRNIKINERDCLVIGVMPPRFNFPLRRPTAHTPSPYVEFWEPMLTDGPISNAGAIGVVGRLRPGVSLAAAQQDVASIGNALSREFPAANRDRTLRVGSLLDRSVGPAKEALLLLMAASVLFLLIGCANVANLLLARGLVRQREIAIRMAIGAGSGRILRQLLTESCVLAVFGGIGGYVLTAIAWKILPTIAPVSIPRLAAARGDWTVLGFALLVAFVNGILFGITPALRAAGMRTIPTNDFGVRGGSGSRNQVRGSLVVAEVAITVVLVVIGAQLLRNFVQLLDTDPGFDADRLVAAVVIPSSARYHTSEDRALAYRRFIDTVRNIPGIDSAGTVDALPFSGENHGGLITDDPAAVMQPRNQLIGEVDVVSPQYLQTLGVHLSNGRWFGEEDSKDSSDTAIVNDIAASRLWPGENPIGKRICLFCTPENPNHWKRVVGVVSTVRHADLDRPMQANVYTSASSFKRAVFLVVRTSRSTGEIEKEIREAIAKIDPNQPVFLSASMKALIADSLADRRFIATLLGITGFLALVMSMAGVYGVTSYLTSRRTQEIGVRMALGATPANVLALIFRQGFFNAALGLTIGVSLTAVSIRFLRGTLVGFESSGFESSAVAVCLVCGVAAISCLFPARRAARIEPMSALRHE